MSFTRAVRVAVFAALAGCGNPTTVPGNDCATNPAKCGCADDSTCAAPTPRCDTRTTKCVPCLPTADNCPNGQHCLSANGSYSCVPKDSCMVAGDCPGSGDKP